MHWFLTGAMKCAVNRKNVYFKGNKYSISCLEIQQGKSKSLICFRIISLNDWLLVQPDRLLDVKEKAQPSGAGGEGGD